MTLFEKPSKELPRAELSENISIDIKKFKKVHLDKDKFSFVFTGYSVVKSHDVKFDDWNAHIFMNGEKVAGFEGTIKAASVNTGIEMLNNHLKSDDFFDIQKFPEIKFLGIVEGNKMKGKLIFRGITKGLTFPVHVSDKGISAEFYFDTTHFKIKYIGINKEIKAKFEIHL